ncbi:sulfotransferase domain-containing protein [Emticicia sp. 21SJ11W-3]|uniref:sulfotransferase domain-containing protein n=1 Tax=Emticicia sp. 21SJ11W-3 TaxID=2916755 RepID=UPI00209DDBBB|nr:sulfotransferase domain-containing protein [Emticicia sp. 21SJ11W-3]UTA68756.1 sulfotransferase domain-containing protein [Emticicia sp. 21SJ11W-3]
MTKYKLVWLASYPKSGNTWVRSFFTALLKNEDFNINSLDFDELYANKTLLQKLVQRDISTFNDFELEALRRKFLNFYVQTRKAPYLQKIHDQFSYSVHDNLPVFHTQHPTAVIYIMRDPLDVTLSFSRYLGISPDEIIDRYICKSGSTIYMDNYFPRVIGTWEEHFYSWFNQAMLPVHFVKYEEMKLNPNKAFKEMINFLGLDFSDEAIAQAINKTDFNSLKKMETAHGFKEKLVPNVPFFHTGEVNQGKKKLTRNQIEKIYSINNKAAKKYDVI